MSKMKTRIAPSRMTMPSRRPIVAFSGRERLQNAVRRVNRWFKRRDDLNDPTSHEVIPEERRKVILRVRTRGSKKLQEDMNPKRSLKAYLALPVTEYSLLDPTWIQRVPNKGSTAFRVTVPLDELLGINLKPVLDVRVRTNPLRNSMVAFVIEGVSFGRRDLDESLALRVRAVMSSNAGGRPSWIPFGRRESPEIASMIDDVHDLENIRLAGVPLEDMESDSENINLENSEDSNLEKDEITSLEKVEEFPSPSLPPKEVMIGEELLVQEGIALDQDEGDDALTNLNCHVQLRVTVAIPPVMYLIPRIILRSTGRIILRSVLNGALPNFLDLVAADYYAWSSDSPTRFTQKGSLFKPDDSVL